MVRPGGGVVTALALSFFLGACATTQSIPNTALPTVTKTGVQPGDQVVIVFYTAAGSKFGEITGDRTVDDNGEIFRPFLGTVSAIGLEADGIRELLEARYSTLYADPVVEVVANIHVNVTGAEGRAGRFFLPPSASLIDTLSMAGGSTSEVDVALPGGASDPSQVHLVRDGISTVIDMRPCRFVRKSWPSASSLGIGSTCPEPGVRSSRTSSGSTARF